jgi:hypothetical protein
MLGRINPACNSMPDIADRFLWLHQVKKMHHFSYP